MQLIDSLKEIFKTGANSLKGHARRIFMAKVVKELGKGGQRLAETELGWNRTTIRKGTKELESGLTCLDNFSARGRKKAEDHLPNLRNDIKSIVDSQSQTDPSFKTNRLYRRISSEEIRQQLMIQKDYDEQELPCEETIRRKLNELGYHPKKVRKCQPLKKIPETEAIFEQLAQTNKEADTDETMLRVSIDAKAVVLLDWLSRGGYNRVEIKALDHDFHPDETVTPVSLFLPQYDETYIFLTTSNATNDFIVDCLNDFWETVNHRFPLVKTLVINQDNGPDCNSHRTQFMKRATEFSDEWGITMKNAYYPPYHSKYNPVERVWGILENYWAGDILDTVETVKKFAQNMTYNGIHPVVKVVRETYNKGVKLTKKAMNELEKRFERKPGLEKWFVRIVPVSLE
jgi:hypothetical protein